MWHGRPGTKVQNPFLRHSSSESIIFVCMSPFEKGQKRSFRPNKKNEFLRHALGETIIFDLLVGARKGVRGNATRFGHRTSRASKHQVQHLFLRRSSGENIFFGFSSLHRFWLICVVSSPGRSTSCDFSNSFSSHSSDKTIVFDK